MPYKTKFTIDAEFEHNNVAWTVTFNQDFEITKCVCNNRRMRVTEKRYEVIRHYVEIYCDLPRLAEQAARY